jgi:ribosome-associated toxin RatA of RatAB toxin-antitoxin module
MSHVVSFSITNERASSLPSFIPIINSTVIPHNNMDHTSLCIRNSLTVSPTELISQQHTTTHKPNNKIPRQRTVAIALDASPFSEFAFHWTLKNLINPETDHLLLLRKHTLHSLGYLKRLHLNLMLSCMQMYDVL